MRNRAAVGDATVNSGTAALALFAGVLALAAAGGFVIADLVLLDAANWRWVRPATTAINHEQPRSEICRPDGCDEDVPGGRRYCSLERTRRDHAHPARVHAWRFDG
jgi:hypothetical protein